MKRAKRKCQHGIKTIAIPLDLHSFITRVGVKEGLNNYEVVRKMANVYAPLFCPELVKHLSNGNV